MSDLDFISAGASVLALAIVALGPASGARADSNPFFAMCTGTQDADHDAPAARVALVDRLGYDGTDHIGVDGLEEVLSAIDARGTRFFALYTQAGIDGSGEWAAGLEDAMPLLEGRDAVIWLPLTSETFSPSDPAGDSDAVALVRRLADRAAAHGLRVALYPHTSHWLERVEDAVRVAKAAARPNVGVTFNLCHWLMVDGEDLRARLVEAQPHLLMVTINGADASGDSWNQLIQPLGDGSYDVRPLLALLDELEYNGPIGLQGYGIPGDVAVNLRRSMAAWRSLTGRD